MSYNDRNFHPAEILNSHPFVGSFYDKLIYFLYEGLKQLGQAITSEMFLLSSLNKEEQEVRRHFLVAGADCLGMGIVESVLLKVPCPAICLPKLW